MRDSTLHGEAVGVEAGKKRRVVTHDDPIEDKRQFAEAVVVVQIVPGEVFNAEFHAIVQRIKDSNDFPFIVDAGR